MVRILVNCLLLPLFAVSAACLPGHALAQARGGPPAGLPAGMPPGIPAGPPSGPPAGPPGGMPDGPPVLPPHGPPVWAGEGVTNAPNGADGIASAQAVRAQALAKRERARAAQRLKADPRAYEVDRNGALAIRGEVLATGLDAADLARIERKGFSILRRDEIAGLGTTLAVVVRDGTPAERAVRMLRRIAPHGTYALNHVMFESGTAAGPATVRAGQGDGGGRSVKVGMIDTGVAPQVGSTARITLVQRNFTQDGSDPELHGTAVAELLARPGGAVSIYAADIFGSAPHDGTSELLIRALGWMSAQRVPVVNVSMVGPANPIVGAVMHKLIGLGFTIVAPVGNDGPAAKPLYPASYPGVIAVSGAGADGRLLPEASRVKRVDFVAPGMASVAGVSGRETTVRGTSFAAPVISRLLADRIARPDRDQARRAIAALTREARKPDRDRRWFGHGLVGGATSAR
ncbi:S8 family serine peptidase [Novosphingobium sp. ZN18A2]|uniref:S8 family serine peptidase n=1 Tax=Novosphingobium sp. ZN18A2 TaxID=3079861 RepID=UPI0030CF0B88